MRKTVFLDTCHIGAIGGGENYLMRFAIAINKIADVYVAKNWDYQFKEANGFYQIFPVYDHIFQPDIHIQCSYNSLYPLYGKKNVLITFFPKEENYDPLFDEVITICEYSAEYVQKFWNVKPVIIYPSIDIDQYDSPTTKKNQVVSIGHFFQEPDGHSKNQHILIKAMEQLPNYKLILVGNCYQDNLDYLHKCQSLCDGLDVEFLLNVTSQTVKKTLAESKFLWHANGYNRTNPAQVEHFGIIALEALASNCIPIVHDSGGCKNIKGVFTWRNIPELIDVTYACLELTSSTQIDEKYTIPHFNSEVQSWLKSLL
jgi:glycosyltransferase involved in cell wall biosynthesis